MEDASIYEVELGDGNSLFAVFDGHGGIYQFRKAPKLASLWRVNLLINLLNSAPIKMEIIIKLLLMHLN